MTPMSRAKKNKTMKTIKFGDKIEISHKYVKGFRKYEIKEIKPKECIYLGKRIIREGFNDEGCFVTQKMITCYLFAYDLRGLIYVPIDSIN